jgi:hypothetical protein
MTTPLLHAPAVHIRMYELLGQLLYEQRAAYTNCFDLPERGCKVLLTVRIKHRRAVVNCILVVLTNAYEQGSTNASRRHLLIQCHK